MERILVPCDFSRMTEKAIKFAADLADDTKDELFLVNVLSDDDSSKILTVQDVKYKEAELKFLKLKEAYAKTGIIIHHKILQGKFLPSVLQFINNEKIDLVVMGTLGSRGWGGFFMGSNIEKVVRTSAVPVFAVRGNPKLKSIHDIVFPCNLKLDQPEILLKIKELQKLFNARLHILYINTRKSPDHIILLSRLEEFARHYELADFKVHVLNEADIKDGILHFTSEINADMIAMVTHGKRDLRHMFTESITADIVNHAYVLVWSCTT